MLDGFDRSFEEVRDRRRRRGRVNGDVAGQEMGTLKREGTGFFFHFY